MIHVSKNLLTYFENRDSDHFVLSGIGLRRMLNHKLHRISHEELLSVHGGHNLLVAVTADNRALTLLIDKERFNRNSIYYQDLSVYSIEKWEHVVSVSISALTEICVGLLEDGTCVIQSYGDGGGTSEYDNFHRIRETVRSWHNIKQVIVSDAIFALSENGRVSYCPLFRNSDDYSAVRYWQNVSKIVSGNQCSVAGITEDHKVMLAGAAFSPVGPHGRVVIDESLQAKDIGFGGSECEKIYILGTDGHIYDEKGRLLFDGEYQDIKANWDHTLLARDGEGRLHVLKDGSFSPISGEEAASWGKVRSYGFASAGFSDCFAAGI